MTDWVVIHKYDLIGGIGFTMTTIFAWFHTPYAYEVFEVSMKILGLILGIILMIISIIHKKKQLYNEKVLKEINELKLLQQKDLEKTTKIVEKLNVKNEFKIDNYEQDNNS